MFVDLSMTENKVRLLNALQEGETPPRRLILLVASSYELNASLLWLQLELFFVTPHVLRGHMVK